MSVVWIVGQSKSDTESRWEFQGIFSTEEKALQAARIGGYNFFIGPANMDVALPVERIEWEGAYYPSEVEA